MTKEKSPSNSETLSLNEIKEMLAKNKKPDGGLSAQAAIDGLNKSIAEGN